MTPAEITFAQELVAEAGASGHPWPGYAAAEAFLESASWGAVFNLFYKTWRIRLRVVFAVIVMAGMFAQCYGQGTTVFNCSSFTSTGTCGVSFPSSSSYNQNFYAYGANNGSVPALVGSLVMLIPTGASHNAMNLNYSPGKVNVQAFTTTFTFVPDGQNISFVAQNNTNTNNYQVTGPIFTSGASGEGSFYQSFGSPAPISPNNVFALMFDSYSPLTQSAGSFTYSSAQIYEQNEAPFLAVNNGSADIPQWPTSKISTSPVPLNSPASTQFTSTGDTYSATVTFTGTNLIVSLYDLTAGESCPGTSCFTHTWNNVSVPGMVNGTTAWVGLAGSNGEALNSSLYINSWVYTVLSAAATPSLTPSAGTYSGTQSVTVSDSSSGAVICYDFVGAPATNGSTGCATGTLYTGAISMPSGRTVYAVAGGTGYGDSGVTSAAYNITGTASMPTFSGDSGAWQGYQNVQLTAAQGGVICYNTTGSPATNGNTGCTTGTLYSSPITVSSNETLYAVAGGTGITDSAVNSATYTVNPFAGGGGQAPVNAPSFSPAPGTYSGAQSVTLSSSTSGSNICYVMASSPPSIPPQTNNMGGCQSGTLYSDPIPVSSTQTIYAIAGGDYTANPSTGTVGFFTINTGTDSATGMKVSGWKSQ